MHSCQSPWRLMTISSPITWTRAHNPIYPFPFLSTLTVTLGPRLSCSSRTSLKYKMYKRMGEQELAGIRDVASRISCLDLLLYEICNPTCQLAGLDTMRGERYCILHAHTSLCSAAWPADCRQGGETSIMQRAFGHMHCTVQSVQLCTIGTESGSTS
jgi:hypothetical protein